MRGGHGRRRATLAARNPNDFTDCGADVIDPWRHEERRGLARNRGDVRIAAREIWLGDLDSNQD